jgi:hypothetical protein
VGPPSVTQILRPYSGFDDSGIPEGVLARASERGTLVHTLNRAYALKQWAPRPTPDVAGYCESFRWWFDQFVDEVLLCEEELVDEELGFMGHPDIVVRSRKLGGIILADEKTPIAQKRSWFAQISAYEHLVVKKIGKVDRIGALQLDPNGKPAKFQDYTQFLGSAWAAFLGALTAYKYLMEGK